jgi:acyl-CoA synthetase (AMP-forming)/AMP-acid ligase II
MEVRFETLGRAVGDAADLWGEAIGWVFEDRRVSFREMEDASDRVARALLAQGIGPGDIVAVLMPNLAEFAFILFGCAKIGAILTALNTRSRLFEIEHVLIHSETKLLITVERFLKQDYMEFLRHLLGADAIGPEGMVKSAAMPRLERLVTPSAQGGADLMGWDKFLAEGETIPRSRLAEMEERVRWRDPVLLQYTSGTTARPKGALCNHPYVLQYGAEIIERLGVRRGEPFLNTQPFYHVGGSGGALPVPLILGCRMVVPEFYEPERVLRLIERERCVARTGFSAMYIMEMCHPNFRGFDLSSLRSGWCVGTPEIMEQVRDAFGMDHLSQIYGSTEASGVSGSIGEPWEKRSRSCGRVVSQMEMQIRDVATGQTLPAGETGEILMRGWCSMNGYLKQPEETARVMEPDGWVHSGDLGMLDADGYLFFKGRIKNMLRVGGENVSAEEIEAMLLRHPKIKMAAVIGAPDPRLVEVPMAIVELKEGASATGQEIIEFCAARMANFRVPRQVRFTTDWPLTGSGKIQIHVLRSRYSETNDDA